MIYLVIAFIIVSITSFYGISFAIWQFKNKNIEGGIMVGALCLSAVALMLVQF